MYGICGWIGDNGGEPSTMLGDMLRECGAIKDTTVCIFAEDDVHCGGLGDAQTHLFADDRLFAVITETLQGASGRRLCARELAERYLSHRDEDFLRRIRGPFAIAIYDRKYRKLLLAVDRAGIRPLYVCRRGPGVAFASRLSALRHLPGCAERVDDQAIFEYLYHQSVPSPGSIYSDCKKLLPAELRAYSGDSERRWFYWSMPYRDDNPTHIDTLTDRFRDLLPHVVERAADTRTPVAALLGDDIGSSVVAGTLSRSTSTPVPAYSREQTIHPDEIADRVLEISAYCDEPFGNPSILPVYLSARLARSEGIEGLLAGDGGDELFAGNPRYADLWLFEQYGHLPTVLRRHIIEPIVFHFPGSGQSTTIRKIRSLIEQARIPLPDRLDAFNLLHQQGLETIFDPGFLDRIARDAPLRALREIYARAKSSAPINRMMHLDLKLTLADNDLRGIGQACALAGIDVRYPLLDNDMMEFAASLPPAYHLRRTRVGHFIKNALADFLPREIIDKKRHDPVLPAGNWLAESDRLREIERDALSGLRTRGYLSPSYLDSLEQRGAGESADHQGAMRWLFLMLELWLRQRGH